MLNYEQKLEKEKRWYLSRQAPRTLLAKVLHHPLILNSERLELSYHYAKNGMSRVLDQHLRGRCVEKLLIAPCGTGIDYPYVAKFAEQVYGIDISDTAVTSCPPDMKVTVGDILTSGYADGTFDIIVSPLFFHHLHNVGFTAFLMEFHRILKNDGLLVILEPSLWYPLNIFTRPLKALNNPYQEVDDEAPLRPGQMINSLKRAGFESVSQQAATYTHSALPLFLSRTIHCLTKPLLTVHYINSCAWMITFSAKKSTLSNPMLLPSYPTFEIE